MSSFYKTPKGIGHALCKRVDLEGSVFIPYDMDGKLEEELKSNGVTVTANQNADDLLDPVWWLRQSEKGYSYVIQTTVGLKEHSEYILKYGMQICDQGMCLLERLSFLEPVMKRRDFLLSYKLSNMVIFSPRPNYRQLGSQKDSVTSAWFVFRKPDEWQDGTTVEYALDWSELIDLDALANGSAPRPNPQAAASAD